MSQIPRTCTGRSGCTCLARHHGQWQGPLSGVAAGVTVRGTAGSMGQLQIMAGGVTGCTVLSLPVPGVPVSWRIGVTGGGTVFGAGALTQAQASRATTTRTAMGKEVPGVF